MAKRFSQLLEKMTPQEQAEVEAFAAFREVRGTGGSYGPHASGDFAVPQGHLDGDYPLDHVFS